VILAESINFEGWELFFIFLVILAILQKAGEMNSEQNNQIVLVTLVCLLIWFKTITMVKTHL